MRNSNSGLKAIIYLALLGIFLFVTTTIGFIPERLAVDTVQGTVVEEYIKRVNNVDIYHIVVEYSDGTTEVFQNHDAFWWMKWNSADVQQLIKVGHTYELTVTGWRVPLFSWFRNIVEFREQ